MAIKMAKERKVSLFAVIMRTEIRLTLIKETVDVSLPAAYVKPVLSSKNSKEEYALATPDQYATMRNKPAVSPRLVAGYTWLMSLTQGAKSDVARSDTIRQAPPSEQTGGSDYLTILREKDAAKLEEKSPDKAAQGKTMPKYGGAASWVTSGAPAPAIPTVSYLRKPDPAPTAEIHASADVPLVAPSRGSISAKELAAKSNTIVSSPAKATEPAKQTTPTSKASVKSASVPGGDSPQPLALSGEVLVVHPASEAADAIKKWLDAVMGMKISDLQGDLRSGELLCGLVEKIRPGLIKTYHRGPRMAFKQMENIGCVGLTLLSIV